MGGTTPPVELYPFCERNNYTFGGSLFGKIGGGMGGYTTVKTHESLFIPEGVRGHGGGGGRSGETGVQIFKDLSPNTGYPVVVGSGGSGGSDHPLLSGQLTTGLTSFPSEKGDDGAMYIIWSGY